MKRTEMGRLDEPALVERLAAAFRDLNRLDGASAATVGDFLRLGTVVDIEKGEALIREGDSAAAEIYLLVDGALVVQSNGGFIARLDRPGQVVGEVAVVLSSKRTADVIGESAARVLAISSRTLALPQFAQLTEGLRRSMLRDDWVQY